MSQVSREQALEVMAKAGIGVDWEQLDSEMIKAIIKDPVSLGREQTRFLANRAKVQVVHTGGGIIPPKGGNVLVVSIPVDESCSWEDAVSAAGPNTGRDRDIWKMGDQYPPIAGVTNVLERVILVNFGKYTKSEDNIAWGKSRKLIPASPRKVFSIGKHCPYLNLAMNPMAVVSLVPCSFGDKLHVAFVWFGGSWREAERRCWFDYEWNDGCWFAFVHE